MIPCSVLKIVPRSVREKIYLATMPALGVSTWPNRAEPLRITALWLIAAGWLLCRSPTCRAVLLSRQTGAGLQPLMAALRMAAPERA